MLVYGLPSYGRTYTTPGPLPRIPHGTDLVVHTQYRTRQHNPSSIRTAQGRRRDAANSNKHQAQQRQLASACASSRPPRLEIKPARCALSFVFSRSHDVRVDPMQNQLRISSNTVKTDPKVTNSSYVASYSMS